MALYRDVLLVLVGVGLLLPTLAFGQRGGRGGSGSVSVRGHVNRSGTYVQPHYRSVPDRSPYNNWSFPGNVNPYTGKVAMGDPGTYLYHYYNRAPSSSYSPPKLDLFSVPIPSVGSPLTLPELSPANPPTRLDTSTSLPSTPSAALGIYTRSTPTTTPYPSFGVTQSSGDPYWQRKIQRDHGFDPPAGLSTYQLMELDSQHYWVKKVKRDHGLEVEPGKYSTYQLMDFDSRIYWAKKIERDYSVRFDWQQQSAYQLMDAHSRMYWAKKLSSQTGQPVDWRQYSAYQLMTAAMRVR